MSKKILFFIFILISYYSSAQNESNIWYFGENAGIDFNSGEATAINTSAMVTKEGCSSISNTNGDLLFYTDGILVYNKNHEIMENGEELAGDPSSTSSSIIIPQPNSDSLYYIFTCDALENEGIKGLNYSIVDISLNNGLGKITEKNTLLHAPSTEKLTTVYDKTLNIFWLISPKYASNEILAYKITKNGIDTESVTNTISENIEDPSSIGAIKSTPDGKKIAMALYHTKVLLYDFDSSTGLISNPMTILDNDEKYYGVEFSSNSNYLYIATFEPAALHQFHIETSDLPTIQASEYIIPLENPRIGAIQLGPDEKIYCVNPEEQYLSVIHSPNESGILCDFEENEFLLSLNTSNLLGLPSYTPSFLRNPDIAVEYLCLGSSTFFNIPEFENNISSILWDFGDSSTSTDFPTSHTYQNSGTYLVTATFSTFEGLNITKTIEIKIQESAIVSVIEPLFLCFNTENYELNLDLTTIILEENSDIDNYNFSYYFTEENAENKENPISDTYLFPDSEIEFIYVRIEHKKNYNCDTIDKIPLEYAPKIQVGFEDFFVCKDFESLTINAPTGHDNYLWSTGEATTSITIFKTGNYSLSIWNPNENDCITTKNFEVKYASEIDIETITVEEWTFDQNTIEVLLKNPGKFEFSIDGGAFQKQPIFKNLKYGEHILFIKNESDCFISEKINILNYPKFFTPNSDGLHDYWKIFSSENSKKCKIYIFDRYGKIITEIYSRGRGWNGQLNGIDLPSSDYWFLFVKGNGEEHRGHFTLKR